MEIPQLLDDRDRFDADNTAFAVILFKRRKEDGIEELSYFLVVLSFHNDK